MVPCKPVACQTMPKPSPKHLVSSLQWCMQDLWQGIAGGVVNKERVTDL